MLKQLTRLVVQTATASLFFLASAAGAASNLIVIGQAIDLSGPNASLGRDYVAGIKTYFDALNAAGGINGKRIQYIVRDDRGQAELAAKTAAELIERDQVDYLFGGVGDEAARAITDAPAFRRGTHILFAPLAAAEPASGGRILFWRPSYKQEIRHIFAHFSRLGIADVGIVYQDSPSNLEAYRSLSSEIQERRMKLSGTARIGAGGDQIAQEAQRLASSKPGFILVIADTIGSALFLKEYRKHDAQTFVAGTSLINLSTLRELAGQSAVEWTVFSQVVPNPGAGTSLLQVEHLTMMRKYRDEAVSSLTLEGFAAAKALSKAIQQSRRGPRNALQDLLASGGEIDLGGLSVIVSNNRLSSYLDIALFKKGSGLVF
ncbi:MAG: ABC transporter substrate-binding protein [Noviherbaspirillum sp.]